MKFYSIFIHFHFLKIHFKMSSEKWRPFCLGLNVLSAFNAQWVSLVFIHLTWHCNSVLAGDKATFNSLAHGVCDSNIKNVIFHTHFMNLYDEYFLGNCCYVNATQPIDDESILVHVVAWSRQTTNHYLSRCWPRSMLPHIKTWPYSSDTEVILLYIDRAESGSL